MKRMQHPEIFAYKPIEKSYHKETTLLVTSLSELINLSKKIESPLVQEIKPYIAFSLKWKFDYLAKTGESPFTLQRDVDYWLDFLGSLKELSKQNWFSLKKTQNAADPWNRTRKAFNFMWPKNTDTQKQFELSAKMVELRVQQIVSMMPTGWLRNKAVLDAGCGPARYLRAFSRYSPKSLIGIDSGKDIIKRNKKRFPSFDFFVRRVDNTRFRNASYDFVISAGVIHHLKTPLAKTIAEHARILKKDGYFFLFTVGQGGLELKMWEFVRNFLYDVNIEDMFSRFNGKISALRLQGLLDHSYGEYQQISRGNCEKILNKYFRQVVRVPGVVGLDVTPEIYRDDLYFSYRFGTGNLRYLCKK